ncbi:DUF3352 domain-containing protein [Desulfofundulus sp. TPOSR]|uniref:DUF3352 domain-containing protein n=1 Tax=Desulfofundulus sp. TPOSR TaxID=2714340 RepID=UPI00140E2A05|nr:DUF3352 domain-containing protein [Desulfofundulus sp. TPOSR]NHM25887.1 DUF3352 domain-containing protein [Desulfofundulus sp. TPOSR]
MECAKCNVTVENEEAKFYPFCGTPLNESAPSPSSSKSKKAIWIGLGVLTCLLLVIGFVARESLAQVLPFLNPSNSARAAKLAPGDTDLFLVVNPNLDQVKNFARIRDIYFSIPEVKDAFDDLRRDFEDEFGLDFKEDVKPWLGREIALIIPDYSNEESYLLAVSTTSMKKASACLQKVRQHWEKEGMAFKDRTYQGVEITVETGGSSPVAYALHEGFLLLAESEEAIEKAIDMTRQKGAATLARNENYKKVMKKLPANRSGTCYINAENIPDIIKGELNTDFPVESLHYLEAYQGLGFSISFTGEGARFDYSLAYDKGKLPKDLPPPEKVEKTIALAPENSLVFIGGVHLNYVMEKILEDIQKEPDFKDIDAEIEYNLGIDIESDLLSWLGSEYGLAIVPDRDGLLGKETHLGMLAMFSVKDVQKAKRLMDKIADLLDEEGFVSDSVKIDGKNVKYFYDPYTEAFMLGYGFRDNILVIGSSENLVKEAVTGDASSLADSDTYKKAFASLQPKYEGCIFIDVERIVDTVRSNLDRLDRRSFDREVYPFVKPLQAVSYRQARTDDNFLSGTLAVFVEEPVNFSRKELSYEKEAWPLETTRYKKDRVFPAKDVII